MNDYEIQVHHINKKKELRDARQQFMTSLQEHCNKGVNELLIFANDDNEIDRVNKFTKSFSQFKHAYKQADQTKQLEKASLKLIDQF